MAPVKCSPQILIHLSCFRKAPRVMRADDYPAHPGRHRQYCNIRILFARHKQALRHRTRRSHSPPPAGHAAWPCSQCATSSSRPNAPYAARERYASASARNASGPRNQNPYRAQSRYIPQTLFRLGLYIPFIAPSVAASGDIDGGFSITSPGIQSSRPSDTHEWLFIHSPAALLETPLRREVPPLSPAIHRHAAPHPHFCISPARLQVDAPTRQATWGVHCLLSAL